MTDDQRELWYIDEFFHTVTLYKELTPLDKAIQLLKSRNFIVHEFDCRDYPTQGAILSDVLHRLNAISQTISYPFISMFSFWDSLRYAEIPQETGVLLVFKFFDSLHRKNPKCAQGMLGSIAQENFYQRGYARRFTACAHSVDPELKLKPLYTLTMEAQWGKEDIDFEAKKLIGAKIKAYCVGIVTAAEILGSQLDLDLRSSDIEEALRQTLAKAGLQRRAELEFDTDGMVNQLREFDFEELLRRKQASQQARRDKQKRYEDWLIKVCARFRRESGTSPHLYTVERALNQVTGAKNRSMLQERNLTVEEAVQLLKGLAPENWPE